MRDATPPVIAAVTVSAAEPGARVAGGDLFAAARRGGRRDGAGPEVAGPVHFALDRLGRVGRRESHGTYRLPADARRRACVRGGLRFGELGRDGGTDWPSTWGRRSRGDRTPTPRRDPRRRSGVVRGSAPWTPPPGAHAPARGGGRGGQPHERRRWRSVSPPPRRARRPRAREGLAGGGRECASATPPARTGRDRRRGNGRGPAALRARERADGRRLPRYGGGMLWAVIARPGRPVPGAGRGGPCVAGEAAGGSPRRGVRAGDRERVALRADGAGRGDRPGGRARCWRRYRVEPRVAAAATRARACGCALPGIGVSPDRVRALPLRRTAGGAYFGGPDGAAAGWLAGRTRALGEFVAVRDTVAPRVGAAACVRGGVAPGAGARPAPWEVRWAGRRRRGDRRGRLHAGGRRPPRARRVRSRGGP